MIPRVSGQGDESQAPLDARRIANRLGSSPLMAGRQCIRGNALTLFQFRAMADDSSAANESSCAHRISNIPPGQNAGRDGLLRSD